MTVFTSGSAARTELGVRRSLLGVRSAPWDQAERQTPNAEALAGVPAVHVATKTLTTKA